MEGEPAEEEEIFQYEMLKEIRKISKSLESINSNLEQMKKGRQKR